MTMTTELTGTGQPARTLIGPNSPPLARGNPAVTPEPFSLTDTGQAARTLIARNSPPLARGNPAATPGLRLYHPHRAPHD